MFCRNLFVDIEKKKLTNIFRGIERLLNVVYETVMLVIIHGLIY